MFWGSIYAVAGSFSHIVEGREKFPLFKMGVLPCLDGGCKRFWIRDFPIS